MPNPQNKIIFTADQHEFLKSNYETMTNQQLATALGLKLTRLRNEMRVLGFKRMELEYWTRKQKQFLIDNYKTMGDREIVRIFKIKYPKAKGWSVSQIVKKRMQMELNRSEIDLFNIKERNRRRGRFGMMDHSNRPTPPVENCQNRKI